MSACFFYDLLSFLPAINTIPLIKAVLISAGDFLTSRGSSQGGWQREDLEKLGLLLSAALFMATFWFRSSFQFRTGNDEQALN